MQKQKIQATYLRGEPSTERQNLQRLGFGMKLM